LAFPVKPNDLKHFARYDGGGTGRFKSHSCRRIGVAPVSAFEFLVWDKRFVRLAPLNAILKMATDAASPPTGACWKFGFKTWQFSSTPLP
jgi:hypothetical protein